MSAVPLQCPHLHTFRTLHTTRTTLRALLWCAVFKRDVPKVRPFVYNHPPVGCSGPLRRFPYVRCLADNMHSLDHKADECAAGQKWEAAQISGCANGALVAVCV